ncbi:hypothetical protein GCM10023206_02680 [Acinetobacter puyangensis]|uniref:Signal peptide containing protein n=1 Tax=Acinetobacter puyangensis TaxID=1096779 RepID=A0A240E6Z0_9GAMM|nr:hypothetical protein [Acinetobacter puyangensis]SNX44382.1 hypothetical protein SAMN05421731_103120 [Acinetobacter puyangensis]
MNFFKCAFLIIIFSGFALSTVQANDVITLPTIKVMAESELREEVGFVPFQEDKKTRQALQHHVYKIERDLQNTSVSESIGNIDFQPKIAEPDMSQFSPALQQYILAVATGLQSSDPSNGIFNMLEPLNINRNNIDNIRDGTLKVNIDDAMILQQLIQNSLRGY